MRAIVNMNSYVRVRMTEKGEREFKKHYADIGLDWLPYKEMHTREMEPGIWRFQLHDLMHTLGHATVIGFDICFHSDIELEDCQPINPPAKQKPPNP